MSTLPASGYLSNASRTEAEMKTAFEDLRDVVAELPGGTTNSALTISGGSITPTGGVHNVLPESSTTDDLDAIDQTNTPDARLLYLRNITAGNTITLKHATTGAGHIRLRGAADFAMGVNEWVFLLANDDTPGYWEELLRGSDETGHAHVNFQSPKSGEAPDDSRTNFTTHDGSGNAVTIHSGSLTVYLNGTPQRVTTDYAEDGDLQGFTMTFAPATGDDLRWSFTKTP